MAIEVYVGWFKGIFNPGILEKLKAGGINGIEMSNIDDSVEKVTVLGYNAHIPGGDLTLNLADPKYLDRQSIGEENIGRLFSVMERSKVVGLHLGYACENVWKMNAAPNQPKSEPLSRAELLDRLTHNIINFEGYLNWEPIDNDMRCPPLEIANILIRDRVKFAALETVDYSREVPIPWDAQKPEVIAARPQIEETIRKYGTINAGILHVTEPSFVGEIFRRLDSRHPMGLYFPQSVGFIADIGHMFISGDAHTLSGKVKSIDDYFDQMMTAVGNKTYEMHLTVPEGDPTKGYSDQHWWLKEGDTLSHDMIKFARRVKDVSPDLKLITLEMREHGKSPEEFADILVDQANLVKRELSI